INYTGTTERSEFMYDGLSRLVKIVEKTGSTINSTKKFVWLGNEQCEIRNATDAVTLRMYPQGHYSSSAPFYYTHDHLSSVREVFKADGTVTARYDYDPYGRTTVSSSGSTTDFDFAGL